MLSDKKYTVAECVAEHGSASFFVSVSKLTGIRVVTTAVTREDADTMVRIIHSTLLREWFEIYRVNVWPKGKQHA